MIDWLTKLNCSKYYSKNIDTNSHSAIEMALISNVAICGQIPYFLWIRNLLFQNHYTKSYNADSQILSNFQLIHLPLNYYSAADKNRLCTF